MDGWPQIALSLIALNADWLWGVDADGNMTAWQACHKSGIAPQPPPAPQTYGHWRQYFYAHAEIRDNWISMVHSINAQQKFHNVKVACTLPNLGVRGYLHLSGVPIYDEHGNFDGYRGTAVNLTGSMMEKRKYARLNQSYSDLEAAMVASSAVLFIINPCVIGAPITYITNSFSHLTGYTREDILGEDMFRLAGELTDPEARARMGDLLCLRRNGTVTMQLYRQDRTPFWAEISVTPNQGEAAKNCTMVCLMRDVTDERAHKRIELQRDRLQRLGQMAGGMAHEINNLLQPAALYSELLRDQAAPGTLQQEGLDAIQESLKQIQFIVHNTLKFSRRETETECRPVMLATVLKERIAYLGSLIPASISIETFGLEGEIGCAAVTPTEVTQVLSNLLNNAMQAMQGRGHIRIKLQTLVVDGVHQRKALPIGTYFELKVSDTGSGMAPAVAERIFEPFFTTKPIGEGTGLGLSVVYGIVTDWGGLIEVSSRPGPAPGHGTVFTVLIPQAGAPRVVN